MLNTSGKTPKLSSKRLSDVKAQLSEKKQYLKEVTSGETDKSGLLSSGVGREINTDKLKQQIRTLEQIISSNEQEKVKLTDVEKDKLYKQMKEDGEWLGKHSQSKYEAQLMPNTKDRVSYLKGLEREKRAMTNPEYAMRMRRRRKNAETLEPDNAFLRSPYSFMVDKHND
jgi:hypothetical protein